ncbi:MAG: threonine--tRNA ligase [Nanoarchaeota archaeon]|nr:threonine--tRNA ligase [Nanoarchaeota archaeon]
MKTLNLHCDYIKFKALKKALKTVDEIAPNQNLEGEATECLVVLTAIEKGDNEQAVENMVESIKDIANQVGAKNIVLYPYAHLSSNLASPKLAVKLMNEIASKLSDFKLTRAPFGYYKSFELKVKGHPLSELSREFQIVGNEEKEEDLSDEERKALLRQISKATLDTSKLKDNDHRIIGRKMDLWSFNNVAPGMVFWHEKGLHIKHKLIDSWREIHKIAGYHETSTPQIMDRKLWEVSGHWKLYHEHMFTSMYEKREFAVKPMNCPGAMLIYKNSPKSYKDLPLRLSEIGVVHRKELSGTLAGLFRVIQMTQDDAHIFCTKKQLHEEVLKVINLFTGLLGQFGFEDYRFTISTRSKKKSDKYLGDNTLWNSAEKTLAKGLDELKLKYTNEPGEAKFYGPSLDLQIKDSLGREWQCSTLQLDFALPERFGIKYTDENGNEMTPILLHRVVYGSLERFIGIITEHLNGKFPMWISPNQVMVINTNDDSKDYAKKIKEDLFNSGFRVEINDKNESVGKKVREASIQRFNYIATVGGGEKEKNTIAVKKRDEKDIQTMSLEDFKNMLKEEIDSKKL